MPAKLPAPTRRTGGRPPKPPEDRQVERIQVNLTRAEREAVEALAGEEPVGGYVRRLVLRHLAQVGRRKA